VLLGYKEGSQERRKAMKIFITLALVVVLAASTNFLTEEENTVVIYDGFAMCFQEEDAKSIMKAYRIDEQSGMKRFKNLLQEGSCVIFPPGPQKLVIVLKVVRVDEWCSLVREEGGGFILIEEEAVLTEVQSFSGKIHGYAFLPSEIFDEAYLRTAEEYLVRTGEDVCLAENI
tara:strand:- start:24995 stop:25513 length:519 start_codon:yes stop_codon:yes gene_type:complete